jgi:hypothetical protein
MGNVNILKELKKISNNLVDDPAPQTLFKYLKGANAFHYGLGKGLGVFVKTQEETTQDKQLLNSIIHSFLKVDKKQEIILPKKERLHRMDISSYNHYLEKHFSPSDFDIDEHFIENEIYHFSVSEEDIKNYVTESLPSSPQINYHLISVSLIYNEPNISMLITEGCDWKDFMTFTMMTRDELSGKEKTEIVRDLKSNPKKMMDSWSDSKGARNNFATKVTFTEFNWGKMVGINPYEEYEKYHECFRLFTARHSSHKHEMPWVERPQEHLKRWVWIPSYFNFFIRKRKPTSTIKKKRPVKSWTRNNWIYKGEKKIPIQVVYTPVSLRKIIQKRIRVGGELRETSIRGFWRRLLDSHKLGKDKKGNKVEIGRTWIKPHTRMIWFKGERVLVKVPFKL